MINTRYMYSICNYNLKDDNELTKKYPQMI